jgi:energy-coupling factor transporter transmembrane protein EcfT
MIFEYHDVDTIIHRFDPRTKTVWLILIMVISILLRRPDLLVILFAVTLIPVILTGMNRKDWIILAGFYLIVAIGATLSQAFFYTPSGGEPLSFIWLLSPSTPVIGALTGGIRISAQGAVYGFIQAFRILAVVNASAVLVVSTPMSRLIVGLRKMGMPALFAFMITTAVRFVPVLVEEYQTILDSLRARNLINIKHPVRTMEQSFSPLIINVIRHCNQLALAAESRAFDTGRERTSYTEISFSGTDVAAFFFIGSTVIGLAVLSFGNTGVLLL